ncbi:hypothetical protein ACP70R_025593 [Stipagrostis hirtigluma subsp. patula]
MASNSKKMLVVVAAAALAVAFLPALAAATEHRVGDDNGWTLGFDYDAWAATKQFKVGDTLVFKYNDPSHTVVEVGGADFAACNKAGAAAVLATGEDRVTLDKAGRRWFVCSVGEHCQKGMKLKITVLASDDAAGGAGAAPALAPGSPSTTPPPPTSPAPKVQARLGKAVLAATAAIAAVIVF